jgi:hypothetical protein
MTTATSVARPLTVQQRLMLDFIDPSADSYYLTVQSFSLHGDVDLEALERSVRAFVLAHPSARSVVTDGHEVERPELVAGVWERGPHLRTVGEAAVAGAARVGRPVDLRHELSLRWWATTTDEGVVVSYAAHHLVFDAWAIGLMLSAVGRGCSAADVHTPQDVPPRQEANDDALTGWDQLFGRPYEQVRAVAHRAAKKRTGPAGHLRVDWPEITTRHVRRAARARRSTPFALGAAAALSALQVLLGDDDVIVGSAAAGRATPAEFDHIGYYSTTIFVSAEGASTLDDIVTRTSEQMRAWRRRRRVQWEPLLERYGATDAYPIKFGFQELGESRPRLEISGVDVRRVAAGGEAKRARRPLDILVGYGPDGTTGVLTYRLDAFEPAQVEGFARDLRARLGDLIRDEPEEPPS